MTQGEKRDRLVEVVNHSLDAPTDGAALAADASYSQFHFIRLFREQTGETPSECRRRLLLERAAHQTIHTSRPITGIALDAGFDSLEGFSRAFRKAYGTSPSLYRRVAPLSWFLPAPNTIHYNPIIGAAMKLKPAPNRKERAPMDLTDRLIGHDMWLTKRILEKAQTLTDAQLDAPMSRPEQPVCFEEPEKTLRDVLIKLVFMKEVWLYGVNGRALPDQTDTSIGNLRKRCDAAFGEFETLVKRVRDDNLWDTRFVDIGCEPPETFTYGGVIAHVWTFSTFRLTVALREMQRLGVTDLGYGDPIAWEMSVIDNAQS